MARKEKELAEIILENYVGLQHTIIYEKIRQMLAKNQVFLRYYSPSMVCRPLEQLQPAPLAAGSLRTHACQ